MHKAHSRGISRVDDVASGRCDATPPDTLPGRYQPIGNVNFICRRMSGF